MKKTCFFIASAVGLIQCVKKREKGGMNTKEWVWITAIDGEEHCIKIEVSWTREQEEKLRKRRNNMKYRIKYSGTGGKWSGWRKTDKTEEEIKMMVGHPKIQAVEWKHDP